MDAWDGLPDAVRSAVIAYLARQLGDLLARELAPFYPEREAPSIHVFAVTTSPRAPMTIHFVAEQYVYNLAQSGSDWADHYLHVGTAEIVDARVRAFAHTRVRHVHNTEREHDDYEPAVTVAETIATARAHLRRV